MAASSIAQGTHGCTVEWSRQGAAFTDLRYSRAHAWRFAHERCYIASSIRGEVRVEGGLQRATA